MTNLDRGYRTQQHQRADAVEKLAGIMGSLKSEEQEVMKLYFGLDGLDVHSIDEIREKIPGLTYIEIRDMVGRVECQIRIQEQGQKRGPERTIAEKL